MRITVSNQTESRMGFRLSGGSVELANSLRRVLLSEVPTIAACSVKVISYAADMRVDVMAERIGLTPMIYPGQDLVMLHRKYAAAVRDDDEAAMDALTLRFQLKVKCTSLEDCEPEKMYREVTSGDLTWMPHTTEQGLLPEHARPRPVFAGIPLARLRVGQELHVDVHCVPGIGAEHAKWSPVCTASYRLETPLAPLLAKNALQRAPQKKEDEPDDILFDVETKGSMLPSVALMYATQILRGKLVSASV